MSLTQAIEVTVQNLTGSSDRQYYVGPRILIGRAPHCDVHLDDPGVSSEHAAVSVEVDGRLFIQDLGSTNGTYVDGIPCPGRLLVTPHARIDVGPFGLQCRVLDSSQLDASPSSQHPRESRETSRRPTVRGDAGSLKWMILRDEIDTAARKWHQQPTELSYLLRGHALLEAQRWLDNAVQFQGLEVEALHREFIVESQKTANRKRFRQRIFAAVIGATLLALPLIAWQLGIFSTPRDHTPKSPTNEAKGRGFESVELSLEDDIQGEHSAPEGGVIYLEHPALPGESLPAIAARYGVTPEMLRRWNDLTAQSTIEAGQIIRVKPSRDALPPQKIAYEIDPGETQLSLAERFGISTTQLRLFNPGVESFEPGQTINIWIEPKPLKRTREAIQLPDFRISALAYTHGKPQEGTLENAIQLPPYDNLYKRAYPPEQWGSSHLIENLLRALAHFRQRYGFDGELVMADISLKEGGDFPPHKSHQSGRDIDIWLPTLRGVYKKSHLGRDRRPNPEEADWFATWHLIESLVETGAVHMIFLTYELQEHIYTAAKLSGRSDKELRDIIQYPNGATPAILRHSDGHIHHIHVRFTCPPRPPANSPEAEHYDCQL